MASNDILVVVFLRGGCDGLNLVGPSADAVYKTERRAESRVERDGDTPGLALKNSLADVDFRFHYKAQPLKDLYDAGHLGIIHACGLTNGTRSHFDATDYMERGTPDNKNTSTGWLSRFIATQQWSGAIPTISTSNSLPISLLAAHDAIAVPNARRMQLQGDARFQILRESLLKEAYAGHTPVMENGARALGVLDIFAQHFPKDDHGHVIDYTPAVNANYPADWYANELANSLKTVAQIAKMDVGMRVATADFGGWDTHVSQNGRFPILVDALSRSLAAFWTDMEPFQDRLTVVVMSEYGRRLKSNDSGGTDHGHGNAMLVLGGHVKGGNIYGQWPGLATEQLDNQVDLAVTTDYRIVLSEILAKRFGVSHSETVFPGFASYKPLGLIA